MNYELSEKIRQELLAAKIQSRKDLECFKRKIAKEYKVKCLQNSELLKIYHETQAKKRGQGCGALAGLERVLIKRPVRSLSGIVNVSLLTKPYPCPGKCIFCPTQKNIPKSYLANEPAVQRAVRNKFSPYKQVTMRLRALQETGHPIDKVEIRVIGGTWSYYPRKYQEWFITECFRACNEFFRGQTPVRLQGSVPCSLKFQQQKNERAKCRVVGISVETRPDYINPAELLWLRQLGVTKVELGVQAVDDKVLALNQRGHSVAQTTEATRWLKNFGFKVSYQVMPGLYGSTFAKDVAMFKEIFSNPNFQPDYLKIYPLALVKNTKLYQLYQQSRYKPYSQKELLRLLVAAKKYIPKWCRVERVIRDIPSSEIVEGGASILNLRETALAELKKQGIACQCIRCREVGNDFNPKEKLFLFRESYPASGGTEIFLSFENKSRTKLYALLRLRLADKAIIRDLHTYGQMASLPRHPMSSQRDDIGCRPVSIQHKGLGKKLMAQAEKIAKKAGYKKIAVISAIGVRPYYRKLGYRLKNTYMVKNL